MSSSRNTPSPNSTNGTNTTPPAKSTAPRVPSPMLFSHAVSVLGNVLYYTAPADSVVSQYFRTHRELGHRDRGIIAELVFAVLRAQRALEARVGSLEPRLVLLAYLACVQKLNTRELTPLLRSKDSELIATWKAVDSRNFSPAVLCDLPDWLYDRLVNLLGAEQTAALAKAMNQSAPLDLRVNTLKAERDTILAELSTEGIPATAGTYSPLAIRLGNKPALAQHPRFLDGSIEVQDEGSQLLAYALAPRRGESVVDFCAGAGGKTLLLGALMRNTGRLYAFDISEKRLAKLKPRLARSGLSNVHPGRIEHERDSKIKRLAGKIDRVLVDAPCSGLGTLRRNPDLKWRQTEASIAELTQKQAAILAAASTLLKPGGRLVYATCSLLPEENEGIVNAFLAENPQFQAVAMTEVLGKQGINLPPHGNTPYLQLYPHQHHTDGFFAAVLERVKG